MSSPVPDEDYLTVAEAADLLGVSEGWITHRLKRRVFPNVRQDAVGRKFRWLIPFSDLASIPLPEPGELTRERSIVSKHRTLTCEACRAAKPETSFPTVLDKSGEYVRSTAECRACRTERIARTTGHRPLD